MGIFERVSSVFRVKEGGKALVSRTKLGSKGFLEDDRTESYDRCERYAQYRRAYERVPIISAMIDVQADQTVQEFYFTGPNEARLTRFADQVNLMRFFHGIVKSMLIYGNAYAEVVKDGRNRITELKVLNSEWMEVYRKPTGDIIGYSETIDSKKMVLWGTTGDPSKDTNFEKRVSSIDPIAHFKYNVIGSGKYGRSAIEPVIRDVNTLLDMESNLGKVLWKYVAPLIWAKVGNDQFPAPEDAVSTVSATLRDLSAESEVTTSHLVDLKVLDFNAKGMDISTPVEHTAQSIITGSQVPSILLGITSGTDRSVAEVQLRSFGRRIRAIQREVKYEFEDNILVKQGLGTERDKLVWEQAEEREREIWTDILRGLVTDGILTPQKANDLLPPRFQEQLPEMMALLNQQSSGAGGLQKPRPSQFKSNPEHDNPNDPTLTTKNPNTQGRRIQKTSRDNDEADSD